MSVSVLMRVISRLLVHAGLSAAIACPWDELDSSEHISLIFDKLTGLPCRSDVRQEASIFCDQGSMSATLTSGIVHTTDEISGDIRSSSIGMQTTACTAGSSSCGDALPVDGASHELFVDTDGDGPSDSNAARVWTALADIGSLVSDVGIASSSVASDA